ncbi:MAG: hypothetical protein RL662_573 [Bacteroidota bacterium]|jgi:glycosyltransferase involved in cell wall biosynthesis
MVLTNPLVSIITPCYNDGKWIQQTIASVFASTYENIEIIIVDDGSKDPLTISVLEQISDQRIKIIRQENQGVCTARNNAILSSNGRYILPVDPDDLIEAELIELAVEKLETNIAASMVCWDYKCFGKINQTVHIEPFEIGKLLSRNLFVVTSMFRRKDFIEAGMFNTNMREGFEDWDFWISLLKKGGTVIHIDKVLFYYRIKSKKRSRNISITEEKERRLRYNIWSNHRELYEKYFVDITQTVEYLSIKNSLEYKVGRLIMSPIRRLLGK